MPVKYVNRTYRKGDLYIVKEPMAKHFNKIIEITRVEERYYQKGFGYDVYYRLLLNGSNTEFGFQIHSIFEQSLEPLAGDDHIG